VKRLVVMGHSGSDIHSLANHRNCLMFLSSPRKRNFMFYLGFDSGACSG